VESLLIQCPIPVIYLNQEQDERLSVIDGNQRLTSLSRYHRNVFQLKGLTAYPELEGNYFHQLDPRFQRHILNRTLRCIVILKRTPKNLVAARGLGGEWNSSEWGASVKGCERA